ncbi:hypothetical protein PC9H_003379 [Pleurotus ostreatus]|uniref:Uncharacterized protein n=2 Tax=Pleurotus TaxID=5320 RepID=A0A8H7A2F2_PLEOS|nr:uncharacterized protein PC9H_003379 [Pleurotus ostreatus]KAF7436546.1 hypothetical protein PC9H_003379 [Pleurotus ostreatus]KAG9222551.1 hypothetical protein CCMSSC00406_0002886 [Pleurotus cornucopiae]
MRPALPVARNPNWELESDQAASLKPVAESYITLQSLRQSREYWLSAFPKFSSRSRGSKAQDVVPPPHTIQTRGRCDLEIGPIIFPDTLFYEVHYLSVLPQPQPQQLPVLSLSAGYTTTPSSSSSATTQPYSSVYTPYSGYSATTAASTSTSAPAAAASQPAPLLSSLTSTTVTPALIHQVNSAASTNPTLANLLQLAASGKASPNQLKTLGLLIQSLAAASGTPYQSTPTTDPPAPPVPTPTPPVKEFDLVIEFPECPYDRFLFPREHVVCERMTDAATPLSSYQDILIAVPIPFANSTNTTATTNPAITPASQISTMRIKSAPAMLWDTISRWVGGEESLARNRQFLSQIKTDRVYLAQRLSEGQLLTTLQTLSAPNFTMKPINPAAPGAIRPKRKYTPRKPKEKEKDPVPTVVPPSFLVLSPQPPPTAGTASASYLQQGSYSTTPTSLSNTSTPPAVVPSNEPGPSAPKKKAAKRNQPVHPRIACFSCDATNVPLIMGGRFCRPCVESGKANTEIPQPVRQIGAIPSSTSTSRAYHPYTAPSSTPSTQGFTNAVPFGPPPPPPTS